MKGKKDMFGSKKGGKKPSPMPTRKGGKKGY